MSDKSLSDLEGKWDVEVPRKNYSSSIQLRTYKLYNEKICHFDVDDIRFMIGQRMGLKYLLPIAFNYLKEDILTEGLYYEGDLLHTVFNVPFNFWTKNKKLFSQFHELILKNKETIDVCGDRSLITSRNDFLKSYK